MFTKEELQIIKDMAQLRVWKLEGDWASEEEILSVKRILWKAKREIENKTSEEA